MSSSYNLIKKLSQGGMAEIFLAKGYVRGESRPKLWCIKRILMNYAHDQEFIKMFLDEFNLVKNFVHPNLVAIKEYVQIEDMPAIVMEFVPGTDIKNVLVACERSKARLSVPMVCYVIREVSRGLHYVHRLKDKTGRHLAVVHRDMSPQNVLISFNGHVKIIDFGVAEHVTKVNQTQAGTLKGKFSYMSPEQIRMKPVDARTDIFATGIVFWEMLGMKKLFLGNSDVETIQLVQRRSIHTPLQKLNKNVTDDLHDIVLKMLHIDPSKRYGSCREVEKDLGAYLKQHHAEFQRKDLVKFMRQVLHKKYKGLLKDIEEAKKGDFGGVLDGGEASIEELFEDIVVPKKDEQEDFAGVVDLAALSQSTAEDLGPAVIKAKSQTRREAVAAALDTKNKAKSLSMARDVPASSSGKHLIHNVYAKNRSKAQSVDEEFGSSRRVSPPLIFGLVATIIGVLLAVPFVLQTTLKSADSTAVVYKHSITIKAFPSHVRISVNGKEVSKEYLETPYELAPTLFSRGHNTQEIEITREGFHPRRYAFTMDKLSQDRAVDIALKPTRQLVTLNLKINTLGRLSSRLQYQVMPNLKNGVLKDQQKAVIEHLLPQRAYVLQFTDGPLAFSCTLQTLQGKASPTYEVNPKLRSCRMER